MYRRMCAVRRLDRAAGHGASRAAWLTGIALLLETRDHLTAPERDSALLAASGRRLDDLLEDRNSTDRRTRIARSLASGPSGGEALPRITAGLGVTGAVGRALTARLRTPGAAVVCALAPADLETGATYDSLRAAQAVSAPVLFLVPRPTLSKTADDGQAPAPETPFSARAAGFGLTVGAVDGADLFAVRHHGQEALTRARQGRGPSVLELACGGADPLGVFEDKVIAADLLSQDDLAMAREAVDLQAEHAKPWARPAPARPGSFEVGAQP